MIISPETVEILKNFMTINKSIMFSEGNVIQTLSETKSVFARAEVEDTFPSQATIYDLQKFLGLLSLTKDPSDIEFGDTEMIIRQGRSRVKYAYCAPDLIVAPAPGKKIKLPATLAEFELKNEDWQHVKSAMSIMGFEEIAFVGSEGTLSIQALSTKNESSDTFNTDIGETDLTFKAVFDTANLKLLPGDYSISVTEKAALFKGPAAEYIISLSTKSEFE